MFGDVIFVVVLSSGFDDLWKSDINYETWYGFGCLNRKDGGVTVWQNMYESVLCGRKVLDPMLAAVDF